MTEARPAHTTGGASRDDDGATAALGLAELLCLGRHADLRDPGPADGFSAGARRTCSARRRKMRRR